jgi:hypothetical protein
MATSPNYAWAEPDNSSLVKNGAADIRTLGDAIDTSVWNVGYGQAAKNKIINGNYSVWQRGTTFTNATVNTYTADRWFFGGSGNNTGAISQQTFTPATAPVAGYEGQFFFRFNQTTTAISPTLTQRIEDVRTFAGQTMTVSFWAKTASSMNGLRSITINQNFGSGGSGTVTTTVNGAVATTTAWTRFSYSVAVPSISGKTLGAGSYLELSFNTAEFVAVTLDLWGVQAEYGSKATPFQTATGTIQGELAACQRYYYRAVGSAAGTAMSTAAPAQGTTIVDCLLPLPVTMRTTPTSVETSSVSVTDAGTNYSSGTWSISASLYGTQIIAIRYTHGSAALTTYRPYYIQGSGYIGLSAEL